MASWKQFADIFFPRYFYLKVQYLWTSVSNFTAEYTTHNIYIFIHILKLITLGIIQIPSEFTFLNIFGDGNIW